MKTIKKWGLQLVGACLTLSASTTLASITNLTASSDATNAQYAYSYDGTPRFLRIYLDTDRVASTGYMFGGIGADYMIENGYLFKYSGSGGGGWAFTIIAPVNVSVANQRVNWSVARSAMGNPSSLYLIANYDTLDYSGVVSQTLASTSVTENWTRCAIEGGTCNFTGSRVIRYGAQSSFVVKTLSGPVYCGNSTFGDPLMGVQKYCELSNTAVSPSPTPIPTPTPTPTPAPTPVVTDWVRCATENGTCSFSGTRNVRYGVNGIYAYKVATGSIACNNATFGDPVVGLQKFCDYASSTVVSATPTPTPTPVSTPVVADWVPCATENGTCSFSGTRNVRYGGNGIYAYKVATGSIACNNATFGDPVVGLLKSCDYSSSTTVGGNPTPTPTPTPSSPPPPPSGSNSQVSYSGSSALIPNPERGFYHDMSCVNGAMSVSQLQGYRVNEGITLIHCYNNIAAFQNAPLSSSMLSLIDSNFGVMRSAGVKSVVRFVYTMQDDGLDATLPMINTHLDQLAPILAKNKDVIATVQMGFIGSWGEWANSIHFGVLPGLSTQNWTDRKALIDKLLASVPVDRTIQIRFPWQKMQMFGSTPISSSEAFTSAPRARIGHHNDCFLANDGDVGTYYNRATEFPYLSEETKYVPIGGETCAVGGTPRTDCGTAQNEMASLHWSYLNLDFYAGALDRWRNEGCFNTISAKMGYRFVLQSGSFSSSANVGGSINVSLSIQNQGYASPYNSRGLELILRNASTGAVYRLNLNSDPRRWLPGSVSVQQTVALPANMPAGTYSLLLNLPDPTPTLYGNPAYSIQLANSNVWESNTGFNKLNANLVVNP